MVMMDVTPGLGEPLRGTLPDVITEKPANLPPCGSDS